MHAGVSLPGCLWPHIAGAGKGMSLVKGEISTVATGQWL